MIVDMGAYFSILKAIIVMVIIVEIFLILALYLFLGRALKLRYLLLLNMILGIAAGAAMPSGYTRHGRHRPDYYADRCHYNVSHLKEVIERYNDTNVTKINELSEITMGYLKNSYGEPFLSGYYTKDCKYLSKGDLTKDGFVYCVYHGDLDDILRCEYYKDYDYHLDGIDGKDDKLDKERLPQDCSMEFYRENVGKILQKRENEKNKKELLSFIGISPIVMKAIYKFLGITILGIGILFFIYSIIVTSSTKKNE